MPRLAELQQSFLDYLLGREDGLVAHVVDDCRVGARTRAEIYRNGYRQRLREAIDTDHGILGRYLGDELFDQMVAGYIERHPSRLTSLRHYAEDLPRFLSEQAPFSEHPVLSELAAFERMLLFVFDAPDGDRVPSAALADLPAMAWPGMRLRFHPSVQLFCAHWNSVPVWQALKAEEAPPAAVREGPCHWLLWRNGEQVTEFRPLSGAELEVLQDAIAGHNFAALCERMLDWHEAEQVGSEALTLLQSWLEQGLVRRLVTARG